MKLIECSDVTADAERMLTLARAIRNLMLKPEAPLDTREVSEALGINEDALRSALNSPAYRTLVFEEFKFRIEGALTRGVRAMDDIVNDESRKTADRIQAHKANVATYIALTGAAAPPGDDGAERKFELLLKKLSEGVKPKEIAP